jgi:hypothetical protein
MTQNQTEIKMGEVFTWTPDNGKCTVLFMVSSILEAIRRKKIRHKRALTPLDSDFAVGVLTKRELDLDWIHNMSETRLEEPVLCAYWHDGTVILIDGSHRYMALYLAQKPTISCYLIDYEDWQPYAFIFGNPRET